MGASKTGIVQVLNALAFIAVIAVNTLANTLPINGITTGSVSDAYPNLFAPAGLTFAIWGLIYVLLLGFILYQFGLFKGKTGYKQDVVLRISPWFILSSLANVAWIYSWHYQVIPLSMALMAVILVCLIIIQTILSKSDLNTKDRVFLRLPFSVYFGWITVATIANVTTLLVSIGWDGFGISPPVWMIVALAAGLILGVATTLRFRDPAYGLVLVWAYGGILIKHITVFNSQYTQVIMAVITSLVLILAAVILAALAPRKKKAA